MFLRLVDVLSGGVPGQCKRTDHTGVVSQSRGHDERFRMVDDFRALQVVGQQVLYAPADAREQVALVHDAPAKDDALRGEHACDVHQRGGEIVDRMVPYFVVGGQVVRWAACAGVQRRTGYHAFETISMEGAYALEVVAFGAGQPHVPHFRMQHAVYSYAADQCSTAYPCADRQIRERMQALRGAERAFPQSGGVRIRIEADGYVERSSEAACKIGVAPSLFGRGGDIPLGRGARTGIYRTERSDAQCGQCAVFRPGPEEVDGSADRFGGRSSGKFDTLEQ